MLALSQDPPTEDRGLARWFQIGVRMDRRWIPVRNPERNPQEGERGGCSLFVEDFPGSFWFLTLMR